MITQFFADKVAQIIAEMEQKEILPNNFVPDQRQIHFLCILIRQLFMIF